MSGHSALRHRLAIWAAALWWGALTTIGFICVPLIFRYAPGVADAGRIAARLFTASSWLAVACGFVAILAVRPPRADFDRNIDNTGLPHGLAITTWALAGIVLALLIEFAAGPRIMARENLEIWHKAGTAMYFGQWLCAAAVLWLLTGNAQKKAGPPAS